MIFLERLSIVDRISKVCKIFPQINLLPSNLQPDQSNTIAFLSCVSLLFQCLHPSVAFSFSLLWNSFSSMPIAKNAPVKNAPFSLHTSSTDTNCRRNYPNLKPNFHTQQNSFLRSFPNFPSPKWSYCYVFFPTKEQVTCRCPSAMLASFNAHS